jgi:hypothetical protein
MKDLKFISPNNQNFKLISVKLTSKNAVVLIVKFFIFKIYLKNLKLFV